MIARTITPSSRNITCTGGFSLLACTFARMSDEVPGTILTRDYKGQTLQLEVLADGFAYAGQTYKSLSAVAKAVTGAHCNGFHFFRSALSGRGGAA